MFPATMSDKAGKLSGIIVLIYAITFIELFFIETNSYGMVNLITSMITDFSGLGNIKELATPGTLAETILVVWILNAAIAVLLECIAIHVFGQKKNSRSR
jgi:hypothetical protein